MTLNDLECPIHLKVRFVGGTFGVRVLWLSELTMRDYERCSVKCTISERAEKDVRS